MNRYPLLMRKHSAATFRPSAETAALHDLTNAQGAGLLIVSANGLMLLGLRGMEGASPHTFAPLGGMVDPGETPLQAAKRENMEEGGLPEFAYTIVDPEPLYVNHDPLTGFRFYTFGAVCNTELAITLNRESLGYGWFNPARLPRELHPGFQELLHNTEAQHRLRTLLDLAPAYANTPPR